MENHCTHKDEFLSKPVSIHVNAAKLLADNPGTETEPGLAFGSDHSSGWYLDSDGNIVQTAKGSATMVHGCDGLEYKKPLVFHEIEPKCGCHIGKKGFLYKKKNDDGLYWKTKHSEIDLTLNAKQHINDRQHIESKIYSELVSKQTELTSKHNELVSKQTELKTELTSKHDELSSKQVELKTELASKHDELYSKQIELKTELASKQAKLQAELISKYNELRTDLSDKRDEIISKHEELINKHIELKTELKAELTSKHEELKTELTSKQAELKTELTSKHEELINKQTELKTELTSKHDELLNKQADLKTELTSKHDELLNKQTELTSKHDELLNKQTGLTSKHDELLNKQTELTSKHDELTSKHEELINKQTELTSKYNQLKDGMQKNTKISVNDGSANAPSISFDKDPFTGFYHAGLNTIGMTANGSVSLTSGADGVTLHKPLVIKDTTKSAPSLNVEGHLYKKPNDNALWWSTADGEVNLTKPVFPIKADNGSVINPSYGFEQGNSGIYQTNAGDIGIGVNSDKVVEFKSNTVACYKPLQLHNCTVDNVEENTGVLYKKSNNKLYWKTTNEEKEILLKNDHMQFETFSADKVVIGNNSLSVLNGDLCLKVDSNPVRKYVCSDVFTTSQEVTTGDVVGILNDNSGRVEKVLGCKWSGLQKLEYTSSVVHCWDGNLHLYTCETLQLTETVNKISNSVLLINVEYKGNTAKLELEADFEQTNSSFKHYNVSCVKINDNPKRYVVAYNLYGSSNCVKLKKIKIDIIKDTPVITVESTHTYTASEEVETFDMVYENTGSIDILVLILYSAVLNNFEGVLFKVEPSNANAIEKGYVETSFCSDLIVGSNKTCRVVLLPGQIAVCSYANYKTFILLPSSYDVAFNTGDVIMDNDSSDCVDMIYDSINAVIISVERTISDTAFLQVYDIFGTKIEQLRSKKISNNTVIPIGLGYDLSNNYVLIYADNLSNGRVSALLFNHNGEYIELGLMFPFDNPEYRYEASISNDIYLPTTGRSVYYAGNNKYYISWANSIVVFDVCYGIQPNAYIGFANNDAQAGDLLGVTLKGQIYSSNLNLLHSYIGKKLYLNIVNLDRTYPSNLTIDKPGNVFVGTCLTQNKILVGL